MIHRFLFCSVYLFMHVYTIAQLADNVIFSSKRFGEEAWFRSSEIAPGSVKLDFKFDNGNKMRLELVSILQLDNLPDLDKLIGRILEYLKELDDSLADELTATRVDFSEYKGKAELRVQRFPPKTRVFAIDTSEIVQVRTQQDTLNIALWTIDPKTNKAQHCFIHFHLNYLSDLDSIIKGGEVSKAIQLLKNDLADKGNSTRKKKSNLQLYVEYDLEQSTRITPRPGKPIWKKDADHPILALYLQAGIQYIKGVWAPSVGAGLAMSQHYVDGRTRYYSIYWEPYFSFLRPVSTKVETNRSDFLTFQFDISAPSDKQSFKGVYMQSISVSYLVHGKGSLFDKNTFKISLPRFRYYSLSLDPEFVFSGFFKKISPSVKLVVKIL